MKPVIVGGLVLLSVAPFFRAWRRGRAARPLQRWQKLSHPTTWPSVSVIIPAWQERGTLTACLTALSHDQYEGQCEIIVVAGGSDGTLDEARNYAQYDSLIRVLAQRPGGGKNGAMNDGACVATGEVLVFLDADTLVTPAWLSALVAALGHDFAASTGKFQSLHRTLISRVGEMSQLLENEARGRVLLQGSGGMAVRRLVFDALGGIPECPYADDWGLSRRLLHAGYRIAYAPAALCWSERPATLVEWWRNELRWRRIHLISLFRLAGADLAAPVPAASALYPYATAWAGLSLTAALLIARGSRLGLRPLVQAAWLGFVGTTVMREASGALETAVYTGQPSWLQTLAVLPLLTVLGWPASAIATVTTHRASLHFKGPRRPGAVPHDPVLGEVDAPVGNVQGAPVGEVGVEKAP